MASSVFSSIVLISFLLLSLLVDATTARMLMSTANAEEEGTHLLTTLYKKRDYDQGDDDPSQYMYFTIDDLKMGMELPIYFYKNDPYTLPPLLPKKEADLVPFSRRNLPFLLKYFSISKDSPQGKAMRETLGHCGSKTIESEVKFCATSLESMLDLVRKTLGFDAKLRVLTTKLVSKNATSYTLQNYKILGTPKELVGTKMLGCHRMPYPYIVYYCHGHHSGSRVFEVSLVGEKNNETITGPAVCHMDTSTWDKDHVAFKILKMKPRSGPVCHFFPLDNLVWVTM